MKIKGLKLTLVSALATLCVTACSADLVFAQGWMAVPTFSNEEVAAPAMLPMLSAPQNTNNGILLVAGTPDFPVNDYSNMSNTPNGAISRPAIPATPLPSFPARPRTANGVAPGKVAPSKISQNSAYENFAGENFTGAIEDNPSLALSQGESAEWSENSYGENYVDNTYENTLKNAAAYYPASCAEGGEIVWSEDVEGFMACGGYEEASSLWNLRLGRIGNLSLNVGATGFTNQFDLGQNSNFGFAEGFNWAMPITPQGFISGQVGFRAVQTNLTGSTFSTGHRQQTYITAGVFLRNDCSRFQAGIVYDWYQDEFHRNIKMEQLRSEVSLRMPGQYEFGFQGAHNISGENTSVMQIGAATLTVTAEPLDCYSLFIRKNLMFGGIGAVSLGSTNHGGGLLGLKYEIPISDRFYINSQTMMYIPKEGKGVGGQARESWGIGIDLVWTLKRSAMSRQTQMSRPMFDVADSTNFIPYVSNVN